MEDREIIEMIIKTKNDYYFTLLIKKYETLVFRILYKFFYFTKQDYIQDIAQEVFINIFEKIEQYNPQYEFKNWLYTITLNQAKKYLRKEKINKFLTFFKDDNIKIEINHDIENKDMKKKIWSEINALPLNYQKVLVLFYSEELPILNIAEILNENQNTIKTWLKRAKEKLKKNLKIEDFFDS